MKKLFKNKFVIIGLLLIALTGGFFIVKNSVYREERIAADEVATLTVHHYAKGTTTKVHEDDVFTKPYGFEYVTNPYQSGELEGNYKNNYYYNNQYTGDGRTGTVGKSTYVINYYYELKPARVVVHHYIKDTTTRVHEDDILPKNYTEAYSTSPYETGVLDQLYRYSYEYNNTHTGDLVSGTVTKDEYVINYYYELRNSTVNVHHYQIDKNGNKTNNKVHEDDVIPKKYNETYTSNNYNSNQLEGNYKNNYIYSNQHDGDNVTGTVSKDLYNINYYYKAKPSTMTVHHYIKNTNTKVHADEVIDMQYTDEYHKVAFESSELEGNYKNNYYYTGSHDGDNIDGVINKDNYTITFFYELKPSVITVHHYLIGTTTKVHADDIIPKKYTNRYETNAYAPGALLASYTNNYYYTNNHEGDLTGTVSQDEYEIIYYYEQIPAKVVAHHYLVGTTDQVHPDDIINTFYGEGYTTRYYEPEELDPDYRFITIYDNHSGDNPTGTVSKANYEVIYYYKAKPSVITVHHYIVGTTDKVAPDDIINSQYTEEYVTNYHNPDELTGTYKNNYEFKGTTDGDDVSGTINKDTYEVIYYYDHIMATITVHHYKLNSETKLAEDEVLTLPMGTNYTTTEKAESELSEVFYIFDSNSGDPKTGPINKTNIEIIYYYKLKPAKVTVHHYIENTTNSLCDDIINNVTYSYSYEADTCTTLSDINYTYKEVEVNTDKYEKRGNKIIGNVLQDEVVITYYYELKPGQIVVHYFKEGTRERVADDIVSDGRVSLTFTSSAKEVEGYELVKEPENKTHTYEENTIEVIYEYRRLKYNIDIEVIGGVGTVTGDETIYYGDDSKENNIVITPDEGYLIEKITINGEEIEITNEESMTLPNFKNVKNNIKIEVTFMEKPIPVPITGATTTLIIIAVFLALIGILAIRNKIKEA